MYISLSGKIMRWYETRAGFFKTLWLL